MRIRIRTKITIRIYVLFRFISLSPRIADFSPSICHQLSRVVVALSISNTTYFQQSNVSTSLPISRNLNVYQQSTFGQPFSSSSSSSSSSSFRIIIVVVVTVVKVIVNAPVQYQLKTNSQERGLGNRTCAYLRIDFLFARKRFSSLRLRMAISIV